MRIMRSRALVSLVVFFCPVAEPIPAPGNPFPAPDTSLLAPNSPLPAPGSLFPAPRTLLPAAGNAGSWQAATQESAAAELRDRYYARDYEGAYGRGRLREKLFGGMTDRMLNKSSWAVFMQHI